MLLLLAIRIFKDISFNRLTERSNPHYTEEKQLRRAELARGRAELASDPVAFQGGLRSATLRALVPGDRDMLPRALGGSRRAHTLLRAADFDAST